MKITLKWDGTTGDRKRAFVVAEENDGWNDLRLELDTDDCNREHAEAVMREIIDRVNNYVAPDPDKHSICHACSGLGFIDR